MGENGIPPKGKDVDCVECPFKTKCDREEIGDLYKEIVETNQYKCPVCWEEGEFEYFRLKYSIANLEEEKDLVHCPNCRCDFNVSGLIKIGEV